MAASSRGLWRLFSAHMLLKSLGTCCFITVFFGLYFWLLRRPVDEVIVMPLTVFDSMIPFAAWGLLPYVSLWVYVSLPPMLLPNRPALICYGFHAAAMCVAGLLCFYFWPSVVPRSADVWSAYPIFSFLDKVDAAGNACPSLHVATALFSGIWLQRFLRDLGSTHWLLWLNALWCVAIIWSTVAIRQHVVLDVVGGVILGLLAAYIPWGRHIMRAVIPQPPGHPR